MTRSLQIDVDALCVDAAVPIRTALQKMDAACLGTIFVTREELLVGVVSDGDFRRCILNGLIDLGDPVSTIMNPSPVQLPVGAGAEETFAALSEGLSRGRKVFPRVDSSGRVRALSYQDHWGLLPVAEPELTGNEAAYVLKCIEQNWISSSGPFVRQFESGFADFTGLSNATAVSNGTVALTLAMQALGLEPGSEVIVPAATFAATANAVVAAGGRPVLADVDPVTWGLSPETVRPLIGERTAALVPVHLYGNPCDVVGLRRLSDEFGLLMIEDCAEAIGTTVGNHHVGYLSDAATFSFFGNKTLTTGEGGMVFFADSEVAARARQLRDHGMSTTRRYWHDVVGYNYRMTNVQAAIGVAQVERADELVRRKQEVGQAYEEQLAALDGVTLIPRSPFGRSSYWLFPILMHDRLAPFRLQLMELLAADGIQTRVTFPALHEMPAFEGERMASALPVAVQIHRRGICLPNTPRMTSDSVAYIARSLRTHLLAISSLA